MGIHDSAISPGQGIGQDTTTITIRDTAPWVLTVTGGGLAGPKVISRGTGNLEITNWGGLLKDGDVLGNGDYLVTLNDGVNTLPAVPIRITSLSMQITDGTSLHAFSPNGDGSKDSLPIKVLAAPGLKWIVKARGSAASLFSGTGSPTANPVQWFDTIGNDQDSATQKLAGKILLKDGKYDLHLTVQGAPLKSSDPTVSAIIDTRPPVISNLDLNSDPNDLESNSETINANLRDLGLALVDETTIQASIKTNGVQSVVSLASFDPNTGLFASNPFQVSDGSAALAYRLSSLEQPDDTIMIAVGDHAGNHAASTQDLTKLTVAFDPATVTPLADKKYDVAKDASKTTLTVRATRRGTPVQNCRVRLRSSFITQSGGHTHDETHRPRGVFLSPKNASLGNDIFKFTDATGQIRLPYRSSGIGGVDSVLANAPGSSLGREHLPVTFNLNQMQAPGPQSHYVFVGTTVNHPINHGCTLATQTLLQNMAVAYFHLYQQNLAINDQSLPSGGPFDLGPTFRVPFWTLTESHFNHRQGNSTDIPLGNLTWRKKITRLGGSVHVESTHWHITTR